jgi:hypothetical protein
MNRRAAQIRSFLLSRYWQSNVWLIVLLLHVPALCSVWRVLLFDGAAGDVPTRFLALNLSALLFLLKIAGVRWLEFGTDRRSLLVLGLAIGLVHTGVWHDLGASPIVVESHQCVAGLLLATSLKRVHQLGRQKSGSNRPREQRFAVDRVPGYIAVRARDGLAHGSLPPRAPPCP